MKEQWKEIPGFNGRYLISSHGRVFDTKTQRHIKPHMSGVKRRNYPQVTLYKAQPGGRATKHTKRVHSLMAITYLGHKYDGTRKYVVDHIDNEPTNNHLSNLQIISMRENNMKDKVAD